MTACKRSDGHIAFEPSRCRQQPSACQITAFSLYLAFLDQLSPPDIQKLLGKWERLPHLVSLPGELTETSSAGTIRCADFFTEAATVIQEMDVIIGNPPWGSVKKNAPTTDAEKWCADPNRKCEHPNREKSIPFIWKAPAHLKWNGKVCFILPHGILFNHSETALRFQRSLLLTHAVDRVVNLTDFQFFLFEESKAPALVISYRKEKPSNNSHAVHYWAPKADWKIIQSEVLTISPQDRSKLMLREILDDLKSDDAPLIWKERFWATPRDRRLVGRLLLMPRLQEIVSQPGRGPAKRWTIAEGFQPFGENDPDSSQKLLTLPSDNFIEATNPNINLFVLDCDCQTLPSNQVSTRRLIRDTSIFTAPHVLVSQGFSHVAFSDVDVSFRHALRGIHGPTLDRNLLVFLAAYLRSNLAKYFVFHTSSNWGVSRAKVHVEELIRLPFPLPENTHDATRCKVIVQEAATIVTSAMATASRDLSNRTSIVHQAQNALEPLIEEYFDIDDVERMLISDTMQVIIPSFRPSRNKPDVPTITHSDASFRVAYSTLLCERLNNWAKNDYRIHATISVDAAIGVGIVVLEKTRRSETPTPLSASNGELLKTLDSLQHTAEKNCGSFELLSGLKVFHKNLLYITKPLGQRFWTATAALNDADEIAATILMRPTREKA